MPIAAAMLAIVEAFATQSGSSLPVYASKNSRFVGPLTMEFERATSTGGGTLYGASLLGAANALRQDLVGDGVSTTYDTTIPYVAFSNNNWLVRCSASNRTGTVAVTAGSKAVVGTGTAFLSELRAGQEITINGELKVIFSITDDTNLTVDNAFVATASGVTCVLRHDLLMPSTDYSVSNVGGFARVTVTAAGKAPLGAILAVHFVTPVALFSFATAKVQFARREVNGADVFWWVADATATPGATNIYAYPAGE